MRIRRPICFLCALLLVIIFFVLQLTGGVDEREYIQDNTRVEVSGIIIDKLIKNNSQIIHIKGECKKEGKYIICIENQCLDDFYIGQYLEAEGVYSNFSTPENDGQFNMRKFYRVRGYVATVKKAKILKVSKGYSRYRDFLYNAKCSTKEVFFDNMPEVEAGTLSAMVLGDKTDLSDEVKEAYQNAGISHILSLSGLHIATIGMCLFWGLYKAGLGIRLSSCISIVCMTSYGVMTGMSTSTARALVMFALGIIAKNIGRTYDLLSAAALSALLLLLDNPLYIYDSGFLMSFLSVEGIGILYPVINDMTDFELIDKGYVLIEKIRQSMCVSASATLATLPVVMNSFYKTARYGIFANIVIVPLMTVVLWLGIIAGAIGNIAIGLGVYKGLWQNLVVKSLLLTDEKILKLYSVISENAGNAKGNTWITGKAGKIQIAVYIILVTVAVFFYNYASGKIKKEESFRDFCISNHEKYRRCIYKIKAISVAVLTVAVVVLSLRIKPDLSVNTISVGQGACNIIYGNKIPTIMIDGGSTDVKEVGKYRIVPFLLSKGLSEIDYLFISHPDADHVNGIKEILKDKGSGIKIRHIFMSIDDDEIKTLAKDSGSVFHLMAKGDRVRSGKLSIYSIYPLNRGSANAGDFSSGIGDLGGESINDMSLVLMVRYDNDFTALYPGDISSSAEMEILNDWNFSNIDMLSVAHHGSKYSSCEEFLEKISPVICTISSGRGNSYGHPHSETLERLEKYSQRAKIFRTDINGQVTVTSDNGKIHIKRFRDEYN